MAVYRFSSKIISRSRGQSVIACAAYRAGDKLYDERLGAEYNFTRKSDVAHTEILLPEQAPEWMSNRQTLWNVVEALEKRKDSQLAREVQLALPRELTLEQNIQLAREFIENRFVASGMVADMAIHYPKASDGELQPHAHVLLTMREIKDQGFGLKVRAWNEKCELEMWRAEWCDYQNKHLALHGFDIRVDHRSFKEQGIDLIPQTKIGLSGSFQQMAAYLQHLGNIRNNGERLLANPDIVLHVLTNQQSTFTHRDIARVVNRYTVDGEQFLGVYEKVKASSQLVPLGMDDKGLERFTSQDMVQLEKEMMGNAQSLQLKAGHPVTDDLVRATASTHQLSAEQTAVLEHLTSSGDIKNVIGFAGTGKSRLLGAAKEAWEQAGYRISGATLSGIAAQNLEKSSNIPARTIASRLLAWDQGKEFLNSQDVLVIDEAGMLGTRQMAELLEHANKQGAKIVLVGDPEQLQAIEAGAAFRGIIEQTSAIELTEIWRQQVTWQRDATRQLATQQTTEAINQYVAHGCLHTFETKAEAMRALVGDWNDVRIANRDKTQIILAYTREEVLELNQIAREHHQATSDFSNETNILTPRGERLLAEGERIYFLKIDRDLGVKNGTLGTILKIDDNTLSVRLDQDDQTKTQIISFSTKVYNHLDYGYATTIHKAQGITVDRASLLPSRYMDSHATYVALSRHKEGMEIYWSKDEFKNDDDLSKSLSRNKDKDLVQDYISHEFDKAAYASYRGLDTLWDTFWEKHGKEWLDKIQHTIAGWVDQAKEMVESIKEQLTKPFSKDEQHQTDYKSPDDIWLDQMRAMRDEAYKNNPELEKELRSARYGHSTIQETAIDTSIKQTEKFKPDQPITAEQRAHYEERYQQIMKEAETREAKAEIDQLIKQFEQANQPEKLIQKIDKEIEMDF